MQGPFCACAQLMRRYNVTSSFIGLAHSQNDPYICLALTEQWVSIKEKLTPPLRTLSYTSLLQSPTDQVSLWCILQLIFSCCLTLPEPCVPQVDPTATRQGSLRSTASMPHPTPLVSTTFITWWCSSTLHQLHTTTRNETNSTAYYTTAVSSLLVHCGYNSPV